MAENSENRRHPRYIVEDIQGNVLYTSEIEVLNISVDGAAIETARRLEVNREYTFRVNYKDISLSMKGNVVWALLTTRLKKDTQSPVPVYRAGVKFTDVTIKIKIYYGSACGWIFEKSSTNSKISRTIYSCSE